MPAHSFSSRDADLITASLGVPGLMMPLAEARKEVAARPRGCGHRLRKSGALSRFSLTQTCPLTSVQRGFQYE